jgi:hypothetical protein
MSVENLKEYARRCAKDPELRAVARDIGMADMDEHMRHAEGLGLDWNRSDLVAFRKELIDEDEDLADLSEEELEEIAGGGITTTAAVAVGVGVGVVAGGAAGAAVGGGGAAAGDGGW